MTELVRRRGGANTMDNTVDNPIDNSSLAISQQELLQLDSAALLLGLPPTPHSPAAVTGEAAVITMCLYYTFTQGMCAVRGTSA